MPQIVIVIDELADLMMTCPQVEEIYRLAQKAKSRWYASYSSYSETIC